MDPMGLSNIVDQQILPIDSTDSTDSECNKNMLREILTSPVFFAGFLFPNKIKLETRNLSDKKVSILASHTYHCIQEFTGHIFCVFGSVITLAIALKAFMSRCFSTV